MKPRTGTWLAAAQAVLLLVPATLVVAFLVFVSYPTLPTATPWQAGFDVALLALIVGLACLWRLAVLRLRQGRYVLPATHPAWILGAALGALVGVFGAIVALEHLLNPGGATELVGFAMLAPGALAAPLVVQLLWERKKAVSGRPDTASTRRVRA